MGFFSRRAREPLTALEAITRIEVNKTESSKSEVQVQLQLLLLTGRKNEVEGLKNEVEEDNDNGQEEDKK